MAPDIDLDHAALAFEHAFDGINRYCGDLGGSFIGGAVDPGFYWGQVRFANGMRLELLEPADIARDDFLRRFLDRNGPGPHHLTFKVPDIHEALERVRNGGFAPLRINLEHEDWKEVFLHPKESHGIVVQLAQSSGDEEYRDDTLPTARCGAPASLDRIVHLVSDLDASLELFAKVLEGKPDGHGDDAGPWVDLRWPGPARVRLWQPEGPQEVAWLGSRPGRLHHLAFSLAEPASVPDGRAVQEDLFEIRPEDNRGCRLRLCQRTHPG